MDNPRPLLDHLEKITVPPTLSSSEWNDRWHRIFSEFLLELEHTPTEDLISAFATSQALYHSLEQESLFSVHLAFEILGTEQSQINTSQALFIYYLVKLSEIPLIRTIYLKPYEQYQQHFLTHPEDASEHLNTFNSFSDLIYLGFNLSEMYRSLQHPLFATWSDIVYLVEQFLAQEEFLCLEKLIPKVEKNADEPSKSFL